MLVYPTGILCGMIRSTPLFVMPLCVLGLCMACGAGQAQGQEGTVRVMTYNIQWFSEDADPGRIANIKSILNQTKPDVVAVQEIQSRAALRQVFDDQWEIAVIDDRKEHQEVGIAVRKPFKIVSSGMVFETQALDFAFPGRRDVMRAVVESPTGQTFAVYSLHMKSRRGGRIETDAQREMGTGLLAAYLMAQKDEKAIVLGDMNDAPDDRSANILETGDLRAAAGKTNLDKPLMVNLTDALYRADHVSHGLDRKWLGDPINSVVEGAYAENERLRGINYSFPDDVNVTQILFDQIFVSANLAASVKGGASIFTGEAALRGSRGRTSVGDDGTVTYTEKGSQASDHLPVYADIILR